MLQRTPKPKRKRKAKRKAKLHCKRQAAYMARSRAGLACVTFAINRVILDWLIRTHHVSDAEAKDMRKVGPKVGAMLDESARDFFAKHG